MVKIDKEYQNFVDRMGSCEDNIDVIDNDMVVDHKIITRNRGALEHTGVIGMKWGHHKSLNPNVIGKAAKTGQDLASLGQAVNKGGFNKKSLKEAKKLSDDDLKQLTNRLNLENNYINAKNQQSGRSKVEGLLSISGSALAVASSAAILYDVVKKLK